LESELVRSARSCLRRFILSQHSLHVFEGVILFDYAQLEWIVAAKGHVGEGLGGEDDRSKNVGRIRDVLEDYHHQLINEYYYHRKEDQKPEESQPSRLRACDISHAGYSRPTGEINQDRCRFQHPSQA
ncbi:hypothetical protein PENTCL1PPCAC_29764, partial [Pristionchus entomophagus]